MNIGITKESLHNEKRVALTPANVGALSAQGISVLIEEGAGEAAGFDDDKYAKAGAKLCRSKQDVIEQANVLVQVNATELAQSKLLKGSQWLIGMMDPLGEPQLIAELAEQGVCGIAMELIPRISRAQNMDVLSSMATIAGYKSVSYTHLRAHET